METNSHKILNEILYKLDEVNLLIKQYQQNIKLERKQLSELDKFDQEGLHFLEKINILENTSGGINDDLFNIKEDDAIKFMNLWIGARKKRRDVKERLATDYNVIGPLLNELNELITKINKEKLDSSKKYTFRTTRTKVLQKELANLNINIIDKVIENEQLFNQPTDYYELDKKKANYHLTRTKKKWTLTKKERHHTKEVICNKKLIDISKFIIEKNIKIYIDPQYITSLNKLLEEELKKNKALNKKHVAM